ncbi:MAG: Bax inhibitor-1 family protein [Eubacteriales bacterium]|nr:Bax inhibitor-1 family protein [Eubacteriales bacterium]
MEHYEFTPDQNDVRVEKTVKPISSRKEVAALNMARVYLWLALGLLITGLVSIGLPELFIALIKNGSLSGESASTIYTVLLVVSILAMIPSMIIISVQALRKNIVLDTISYIIYTVAMGVLLGIVFVGFVEPGQGLWTIGLTFLITAASFALMGLLGSLMKNSTVGIILPVLSTFLIGCLTLSLVNFFLGSALIYWIVDFVLFGLMLLTIAIDFRSVRNVAENLGFENSNNLAIYCAFQLYVDFLWIFLRVLFYVALFSSRRD